MKLTILRMLLIIILLSQWTSGQAKFLQQAATPAEKALSLLNQLTPEERVGQLFLVTFKGTDISEISQIYDLISNFHIGGVVLLAINDNFPTEGDNLGKILALNRELQLIQWASSQGEKTSPFNRETYKPNFIPLLISIPQEGDGYPNDQVLSGLTPLPSEMAIGATWNPELVRQVGQVLGSELAALGFNLLLGPALDVLEIPQPEGPVDLNTRTFGGDPFWVSVMGSAFTSGVHQGSKGRVAVVAKHFPGNGGSDRSPEEEVATVRKSFEQLKNFDLLPFFEITGNADNPEATTDALLASHIRYQGFQENIRSTTRPFSFDPQAFSLLMQLSQFSTWRENGGVVICDNLGSQAVRRFYDISGLLYDTRLVALNAFLAGNDLLYLGDVTSGEDPDSYTSTLKALSFFAQKYREDQAFAQQVDASVVRLLTMKFRLYPNFTLPNVLAPMEGVNRIGQSSQVTFDVARQSATLISPSLAELDNELPSPPKFSDRMVFITDVRSAQQCSQCPLQPLLAVDALQQAIVRLYGTQTGGQVFPAYLSSYSYEQLKQMLDDVPEAKAVENDIQRAQWLIFAMLDVHDDYPASRALSRFLAERPDLFKQKNLVVFAFNAPYYLDATNISKISAYYGLYSKNPLFVDMAARLLFRELLPIGKLPVSVPGIGYDLITATSPDPQQTIPLSLDIPQPEVPITSTTPMPTLIPEFKVGDVIPVKTGVILDHNGHAVPDSTPVQFIISIGGETSLLPQSQTTLSGIARMSVNITSPGAWEIRVESEPAKQSELLRFEILGEGMIVNTPTSTEKPTNTPSPTVSLTPSEESGTAGANPKSDLNLGDWLISLILSVALGYASYQLSSLNGQVRWGLRGGLLSMMGGLAGYCYLALDLPGSRSLLNVLGTWGVLLLTLLGAVGGYAVVWAWRTFRTRN